MTEQNTDYKTELHVAITELIAEKLPREERISAVEALTDAYYDSVGKAPDSASLERLADAILAEELRDTNPHKTLHAEYPFLSNTQINRRTKGRRGEDETNMNGEARYDESGSEKYHSSANAYMASDGRSYRNPIRRTRHIGELIYVDEHTRIRNKERATQYRKDTSPGVIERYNLADEPLRQTFTNVITYRATPEHYRT